MLLRPENARRRLDSLGRITLPKGLRDRMFMRDNEELEFFTFDLDGKMYIALSVADGVDPKYLAAKSILEELGADIPDELEDKINEKNS
jgi:bifunctional DNA-binding transcriptional regulator/antitoxin component of YhaV-PrlF toxin-antitoxin module